MHMVKWGVQLVASEPPQAPGYNTSPLGRLANKKIFGQSYASCLYLLLVRDDLEVTNMG